MDAALGVGILAAGPFGLAAWGWVDQKNELVRLIGEAVTAGRDRLSGKRTPQRYDVLAATHTALVYGAFFTAFREMVGPVHDTIGLTDDDKQRLVDGAQPDIWRDNLVRLLANAQIPLPWAGRGFRANRDAEVRPFYEGLTVRCIGFLQNFEAWHRIDAVRPTDPLVRDIVERATHRYEAEYKALAGEVPEFGIWALIGESDATQDSLSRLEELMRSLTGQATRAADRVLDANVSVNRAVLADPLVNADDLGRLRIPTVEEGYLTPTFRWAVMDEDCRPADDNWWEQAEQENDLDTFLAAYFSSPRSHDRPLVVLGLPGAGKSMFTKVCAARLSGSDAFAVARVPLRQVTDPTAAIHQQIDGVLDRTTHGRVSWAELSDAAADATRVLLIDGLDEFMQASGHAESNYLHNVAEFQRVERNLGHPVSVVVTSRTLVADLARIPADSLIIKLDNFNPDQVRECLSIWDRANPGRQPAIPPAEAILSYGEIAHQPLLLLLLILHGATNPLPNMEEDSTPAQIYGGILRRFIQRELRKPPNADPDEVDDDQISAELWRLGIAAFGMFNRGRHYIEEDLLLADLEALEQTTRQRPVQRRGAAMTAARLLLGKFFFVHAAEADEGLEGRSYEFLHATFSEYLIAKLALNELVELSTSRNRPSSQNWDDDRLYALLSHQLLSIGGAAILPFTAQLHEALPEREGQGVRQILRTLLQESEDRWDAGRFAAYSPSGGSPLQRFATYTANLVLLLLRVEAEPVPLASIAPVEEHPPHWWARMVQLWGGCVPEFDQTDVEPVFAANAVVRSTDSIHQHAVHREWLMFHRFNAMLVNAGFGTIGQRTEIESDDPGVAFAGYAGRILTDPTSASLGYYHAIRFAQGSDVSLGTWQSLLMAFAARNPERFTLQEIELLAGGHHDERLDPWPLALLIAQYPPLATDEGVRDRLFEAYDTQSFLAPMLAGMLIWDEDRVPVRSFFDRLPEKLRNRIEECGTALAPLRQTVDPRRLILVAADLILPMLEGVNFHALLREPT
ncbi:hypothetical protein AB0C07_09250 [Actinoplanes missouriensis]